MYLFEYPEDLRHVWQREISASFYLDRKRWVKRTRASEGHVFLKRKHAQLKLTGEGCQNHAVVQPFNFVSVWAQKNRLRKKIGDEKERSSRFPSIEEKRINFGVNKPNIRRFEVGRFCNNMRPFLSKFRRHFLENPSR